MADGRGGLKHIYTLQSRARVAHSSSGELLRTAGTSSVCFKASPTTAALMGGSPFLSPASNDDAAFGCDMQPTCAPPLLPMRLALAVAALGRTSL